MGCYEIGPFDRPAIHPGDLGLRSAGLGLGLLGVVALRTSVATISGGTFWQLLRSRLYSRVQHLTKTKLRELS